MSNLLQDFRYAVQTLLKQPGFSCVAVVARARYRRQHRHLQRDQFGLARVVALSGAGPSRRHQRNRQDRWRSFAIALPDYLVGEGGILLFATLLASWLPTRRACKVDPIVALRIE